MPIVLLNFPTTILKAYVVESIQSDANQTITTFKFKITGDDVLSARNRAIQKLLSEKKRLTQAPDNDNSLITHIRFYLEHLETNPDGDSEPEIQHHVLLDSREEDAFRIHCFDYEVALLASAGLSPHTMEVPFDNFIFVVVDQMFMELWYFYD